MTVGPTEVFFSSVPSSPLIWPRQRRTLLLSGIIWVTAGVPFWVQVRNLPRPQVSRTWPAASSPSLRHLGPAG